MRTCHRTSFRGCKGSRSRPDLSLNREGGSFTQAGRSRKTIEVGSNPVQNGPNGHESVRKNDENGPIWLSELIVTL